MVSAGWLVRFSAGWRLFGFAPETTSFPETSNICFFISTFGSRDDVPLTTTNDAALRAEQITTRTIEVLRQLSRSRNWETSSHFLNQVLLGEAVGHVSGSRWLLKPFTPTTEVIVQVSDKEATPKLIGPLQEALNKRVPGAWITVRQLQTNPVETPVEILISGQADVDPQAEIQDIQTLRTIASQAMDIVRPSPGISVLRDDWDPTVQK